MKSMSKIMCLVVMMLATSLFASAVQAGGSWTTFTHSCPGANRTDALHRDADGSLWVGCGTNASGYGLHASFNDGASWDEVEVTPSALMNQFRVFSISRGHDGALYVAGIQNSSGNMVIRLDTTPNPPYPASVTLSAVAQIGRQFQVGSYRELSDGQAIAESLTGTDLLYRPDSATGSSAADWTIPATLQGQILSLVVHDDEFYGSGSTNSEPPRVYLPPQGAGSPPYDFERIDLDPFWEGELEGVAANDQRVVLTGIDQDLNIGKILVSTGDPYSAANYLEHEFQDIVGTGGIGTWGRGVCMRGDRVVAVGERLPQGSSSGLAMASTDGGATFIDITPPSPVPPSTISRCVIAPDGLVIVAGGSGFVGLYDGLQPGDSIFADRFDQP
ncbi:MAG: hypothetical protein U5L08_04085 [Xanthomonadales bacterium]|nr:hypothetical protein [Xanthomonadales bacterium]